MEVGAQILRKNVKSGSHEPTHKRDMSNSPIPVRRDTQFGALRVIHFAGMAAASLLFRFQIPSPKQGYRQKKGFLIKYYCALADSSPVSLIGIEPISLGISNSISFYVTGKGVIEPRKRKEFSTFDS